MRTIRESIENKDYFIKISSLVEDKNVGVIFPAEDVYYDVKHSINNSFGHINVSFTLIEDFGTLKPRSREIKGLMIIGGNFAHSVKNIIELGKIYNEDFVLFKEGNNDFVVYDVKKDTAAYMGKFDPILIPEYYINIKDDAVNNIVFSEDFVERGDVLVKDLEFKLTPTFSNREGSL